MKMKKFGLFVAVAALVVAGFASCQKDPTAPVPKVKVQNSDRQTIEEFDLSSFGTAPKGLLIFVTPGSKDVKISKLVATGKTQNGALAEKVINTKKNAGDYEATVTLADLGLDETSFNEVTELTFTATDSNGKTGFKTITKKANGGTNPPASAGTPMKVLGNGGPFYMNNAQASNEYLGSFNLASGVAVASNSAAVNCITNTSVAGQGFTAGFKSSVKNDLNMGKVTGIDFEKVTNEQIAQKQNLATSGSISGLNAGDLVLIVKGKDMYLLKIETIKTDQWWKNGEQGVTQGNNNGGYMSFKVKTNKAS